MVPNGWCEGRVEDLLYGLESGVSVNGEERNFGTNEKAVLKVSAVTYGSFNPAAAKVIDGEELERAKTNPKRGQVIISRSNTEELVGASAYVDQDYPNLFLPDKLWQTIPKANADMKWLSYVLASNHARYTLSNLATGTSGSMKNITKGELLSLKILIPPESEQKKIAKILSTWDKAITTVEQMLVNSQQQKKALMQQLLTGKKRLLDRNGVRFSGKWKTSITPYKQLPNDWSEIGLSRISSFITKGSTPTTYGYEWQDNGIPFIRSECVGESGFKESGLAFIGDDAHKTMSRSQVFSGDILITITGNVGRVCKLPESIPEANINQHIAKITLDKNVVCPDFVFHCLQDRKYRIHFERITTGQAYPQISLVQVRDVVIPMPTVYEQQKIAAVLSNADHEIISLQKKLYALKQEKKALMQQLLTGKRRVLVS